MDHAPRQSWRWHSRSGVAHHVVSILSGALLASAAEAVQSQRELSLDDVLNLKVTVAAQKETPLREQPGIVSVVTQSQMRDIGARDLRDVLNVLVPGFNMVGDCLVDTSLSVRGIPTLEGRLLLMLNGIEMNEDKYGNLVFADRFPIDYIDRIEVIRGPGSAVYGGYAAMAVINIITRGATTPGTYTQIMSDAAAPGGWLQRRAAAGTAGQKNGTSWSINTVRGVSTLSLEKYTSYLGEEGQMRASRGGIGLTHADLGITHGNTNVKIVAEQYVSPHLDFDSSTYIQEPFDWQNIHDHHDTYGMQISHDIKSSASLKVTPYVRYKMERAFYVDQGPLILWSRHRIERRVGGIRLNWDANKTFNYQFGVERYQVAIFQPHHIVAEESISAMDGSGHTSYSNTMVFAQVMTHALPVDTTLGVRYDRTDAFGDNTAPRLVFTRVFSRFHFKYQLAESFKVPGGMITALKAPGAQLIPERALNNELEMGYKLGDSLWFVTNFFDIMLRGQHVFSIGENGWGTYKNGGRIGTRGFESELKLIHQKTSFNLNFATYHLLVNDEVAYQVPGHPEASLGSPNQRMGFSTGYNFTPAWSLFLSGYYRGRRYAFSGSGPRTGTDGDGNAVYDTPVLKSYRPATVVNLAARDKGAFGRKGLELDIALQNLTNEEQEMGQFLHDTYPIAPLTGLPRSFTLSAIYEW